MAEEGGRDRREIAQGKLEVNLAEKYHMQGRMDRQQEKAAYDEYEEDEQNIQGMYERGAITDEEARRLRTRAKMHKQRQQAGRKQISAQNLAGAGVITTEELIEQALKTKRKSVWIECLRKLLRLDRLEVSIMRERRRRMHPDYKPLFPLVHTTIKNGMSFELVMFSLVAMNSLLTGIQISVKGTDGESDLYRVLEETFTIAFVGEIVLRVMADGWLWFFDWGNFLDFSLIVGTGVIPTFLGTFLNLSDSPLMRCGQALRGVRLVRILKKVRAKFQTLWSLVNGIAQSGRILLWTLVIMSVILYMFALFGVQLMQKSDLQFDPDQQEVVDIHFPDVMGGMFTLFQIITLDSWTGISRPLQAGYWLIGLYFLAFVCVACMVLNNLIVAVICNNAFKSVEEDVELQAAIAQAALESEISALIEVFDLMAVEGSDVLTKKEYERGIMRNEQIVFKLKLATLADDEIENLWEFMTFPDKINSNTFASQLRSLKGDCKAKDSYKVAVTLHKLTRRIEQATHRMEQHRKYCEMLQKDVLMVQQEIRNLMVEVRGFLVTGMRCIPPDPVPMTKKNIESVSQEVTKLTLPNLKPLLNREYERRPLEQKKLEEVFPLPGQIEDIPRPQGIPSRLSLLDASKAQAMIEAAAARQSLTGTQAMADAAAPRQSLTRKAMVPAPERRSMVM
eukprot:TRINITY_DN4024_c0_g1_i1.p1 TRINITY_DN4024_c0_g1~~TRINITY_DN4024_c0_g1_i1.p1  ORF type:complete len:678 (-),score=113.56 TRINITY_DN4024_c0_g1_i1:49-2082(-)